MIIYVQRVGLSGVNGPTLPQAPRYQSGYRELPRLAVGTPPCKNRGSEQRPARGRIVTSSDVETAKAGEAASGKDLLTLTGGTAEGLCLWPFPRTNGGSCSCHRSSVVKGMNATELIEHLLQEQPLAEAWSSKAPTGSRSSIHRAAQQIVGILLGEEPVAESRLSEASVHRSKRSRIWQAAHTAATGGQTWRSTGLTNRHQALLLAKKWEADARAERAKLGGAVKKLVWRVRRQASDTGTGPLTQRETALLLGMSERAVRQAERRALQKLRNHPVMREIWKDYLGAELDEEHLLLTREETEALLNLARTPEEERVVRKVLALVHG